MRIMRGRQLVICACLAIGVPAGATACGDSDSSQSSPREPAESTVTAAAAGNDVEEFEVDGAPTAVATSAGAVWVVLDQGDRVARS